MRSFFYAVSKKFVILEFPQRIIPTYETNLSKGNH